MVFLDFGLLCFNQLITVLFRDTKVSSSPIKIKLIIAIDAVAIKFLLNLTISYGTENFSGTRYTVIKLLY